MHTLRKLKKKKAGDAPPDGSGDEDDSDSSDSSNDEGTGTTKKKRPSFGIGSVTKRLSLKKTKAPAEVEEGKAGKAKPDAKEGRLSDEDAAPRRVSLLRHHLQLARS